MTARQKKAKAVTIGIAIANQFRVVSTADSRASTSLRTKLHCRAKGGRHTNKKKKMATLWTPWKSLKSLGWEIFETLRLLTSLAQSSHPPPFKSAVRNMAEGSLSSLRARRVLDTQEALPLRTNSESSLLQSILRCASKRLERGRNIG